MHDFLIGLAFVGMVIFPAVVATFSHPGLEDDENYELGVPCCSLSQSKTFTRLAEPKENPPSAMC